MRRRRVNSREKRWGTSERGAAKVGRASRPERPKSVYTGRPTARRLGARARGFASSPYVSTSRCLTTSVYRHMVRGRRWAMGTCRPPSWPHMRTPSLQHAHARVDAPAHHIFHLFIFAPPEFFSSTAPKWKEKRKRQQLSSTAFRGCLKNWAPISYEPRDDFVRH